MSTMAIKISNLSVGDKERILVAILVILWTIVLFVLCSIIVSQEVYIDALEYQVAERDNLIEKLCYNTEREKRPY